MKKKLILCSCSVWAFYQQNDKRPLPRYRITLGDSIMIFILPRNCLARNLQNINGKAPKFMEIVQLHLHFAQFSWSKYMWKEKILSKKFSSPWDLSETDILKGLQKNETPIFLFNGLLINLISSNVFFFIIIFQ